LPIELSSAFFFQDEVLMSILASEVVGMMGNKFGEYVTEKGDKGQCEFFLGDMMKQWEDSL